MPGKSPFEAVNNYIGPLQQSLSCFTKGVLRPSGYDLDEVHLVTLSQPAVELMTRHHEILHLSFIQRYSIEKHLLSPFKIKTRAYMYTLEDENHREILGFHWHPEASEVRFPHLHIYEAAGQKIRPEIRKIHFHTDRVAFEEFCLILLRDFAVEPERDDAEAVLISNCAKFKAHRTWASV